MTEAEKDEEIKRLTKMLKSAHTLLGQVHLEVEAIKNGRPIVVCGGEQYELRQYKRLFNKVAEGYFAYKRGIMSSGVVKIFVDDIGSVVREFEEDDQL